MIELAPPELVADVERLHAFSQSAGERGMLLIGRRHLKSNNSWMHNIRVLMKGSMSCSLLVHPDDAAELGLVDGASATVTSRVGSVTVAVEVTDEMRPGVVSLPHGWGHGEPGTTMRVAAEKPGVNSNVLSDDRALDPLSGTSVLNGIPVMVAPAS
jgi:anaerobic selenocysteine-containing dehydrogenase